MYSDVRSMPVDMHTARKIVDEHILKEVDFSMYEEATEGKAAELELMRTELSTYVLAFIEAFRSCPFYVFRNCYCQPQQQQQQQQTTNTTKKQHASKTKVG